MGKIKQLSLQEIQKIAAGEVVERPASVVKELVENAIDAHASQVSIYIENQDPISIRVIDNGVGMASDDAQLCFDHHATSKLDSFDHLYQLSTFGFRGEALTSISAVSKVTLITKQEDSLIGTQIKRKDGVNEITEVSCQTGTDILVHDLFYNVPARKKFLKTANTEWRHILTLFQAFCFDYPEIHFKIFLNNQLQYNCPPTGLLTDRVFQLFDHQLSSCMIPITALNNDHCIIDGIISNYQTYRYDRGALFFFVNKRWVKNSSLSKAFIKGYMNIIPPDRFPAGIINITIDPSQIDINVHPRKEEIAFVHARAVETHIQTVVKNSLSAHASGSTAPTTQSYQPEIKYESFANKPASFSIKPSYAPAQISTHQSYQPKEYKPYSSQSAEPITQPIAQEITAPIIQQITYEKPEVILKLIGYFDNTYLLVDHPEGLMMIDQHAAHERILYEEFKQRFGTLPTIQLLFPDFIELAKEQVITVMHYHELFSNHGIVIDQLSNHHIVVKEVAAHLKNVSRLEIVNDILALIREYHDAPIDEVSKTIHEKVHAQMACKAAVKAGDQLAIEQQQKLIDQLEECENNIACPHGRPIRWLLSKHEIEVKFKRKM